jgi:hypothetical protein
MLYLRLRLRLRGRGGGRAREVGENDVWKRLLSPHDVMPTRVLSARKRVNRGERVIVGYSSAHCYHTVFLPNPVIVPRPFKGEGWSKHGKIACDACLQQPSFRYPYWALERRLPLELVQQ